MKNPLPSGWRTLRRLLIANALLLVCLAHAALGQNLTGPVTDAANGEALAGVSLLLKGTTQGTVTDGEGKYALRLTNPATATVVVSFTRPGENAPPQPGFGARGPRYAADGISPLIAEIRRERRVELFMEGFRYADVRRWKQGRKLAVPTMGMRWDAAAAARYPGATVKTIADPVSKKTYIDVYAGTDWANPVFDESKHYLWPIPLNTLAQNPAIKQNPGWQ